jgi:hypothetical protein
MKRKKIFIIIGILQIISLINMFPFYYRLARHLAAHINLFDQVNKSFLATNVSHIMLFLIILVSLFLYFMQKRFALRLYYIEFILRVLLFMTTYGFLLRFNIIFKNQRFYNDLVIVVIGLEIVRLIISVFLDIKWKKGINAG